MSSRVKKRKDPLRKILPPDHPVGALRWHYLLQLAATLDPERKHHVTWKRVRLAFNVCELVWYRYCKRYRGVRVLTEQQLDRLLVQINEQQRALKTQLVKNPDKPKYRKRWDPLVRAIAETAVEPFVEQPP